MSELALELIAKAKAEKWTYLDLGKCGLTVLPEELFELEELEELVLSSDWWDFELREWKYSRNADSPNLLQHLAGNWGLLSKLVKLTISYQDKITDLTPIANLKKLKNLQCSSTQITDWSLLANFRALQSLDCSSTQITDLTPIANLKNLENLDCSSTKITDLTPLTNLQVLNTLYCSSTQITDLRPLANLKVLKELYCSSTQITDLGPLANSQALNTLYCNSTQITDLSPLANLQSLKELNCYSTQITDLNPLANLQSLKELNCFSTQVTDLPKSIAYLPKLENISFPETVKNVPPGLYSVDDIRAYFQQIEEDFHTQPDLLFKVVLLGNGCVGKTSLLGRLEKGDEAILPTIEERTHAIQMKQWSVPASELIANIWDFGGQEIYHATHRLFLASRALYLVLWSGEMREAEEAHYNLEYWLDLILAEGQHNRVIVVQNRFEREAEALPPSWYELAAYYEERGLQLERPISVDCWNNEGIDKVKKQIKRSLEDMQEQRDYPLPAAWVNIRDFFLTQREQGIHTLPYSAFEQRYREEGMAKEAANALLQFLHHNGIIYYRHEKLNDDIILNQQWAIDALYAFLDRKNGEHYEKISKEFRGILPLDYLPTLWPEPNYNEEQREILLGFITSNEIGFEVEDGGKTSRYLIPQLLPEDPEAVAYDRKRLRTTFRMKVVFPFLHRAIVDRMLFRVRKLDYSSSTRSAIIIKDLEKDQGAYLAYLEEEGNSRSILIEAENKLFGVQLLNEVGNLISLERAELLASFDGIHYVPIEKVREAWQASKKTVLYNGQEHLVSPLQLYLTLDKEERLFEGDVPEELLKENPDLRYATAPETVRYLVKKGELDKAIASIPAQMHDNELTTVISNYRKAKREHTIGTMTDDKFAVAYAKCVSYLLEYWLR